MGRRERLMFRVDRPGEERHIIIGLINGLHWTAVTTLRGEAVRIISARRARKEEIKLYEQK